MLPLAHAGHWLAQVAYALPLVLVVVALVVSKLRDKRSGSGGESDGQAAVAEGAPQPAAGPRRRS